MTPIFPTAYFGNISYYKALFSFDAILIESNETYVKQSIRNRCEIVGANGLQQLSIPVTKINGSKTKTNSIVLSNETDWKKLHWKAIETAYAPSPYFEHYCEDVRRLIFQEENNLLQFNTNIHEQIINWLGIKTSSQFTSEYMQIPLEFDFRNKFNKGEKESTNSLIKYTQVFENEIGHKDNLSILDAIFCLGPMARTLID